MAANRALVAPYGASGGRAVTATSAGGLFLYVSYVILDSSGAVVNGKGGLETDLVMSPGYNDINNIDGFVQDSVKTNEGDSSLQVYLL
jgi:hypothetical protein